MDHLKLLIILHWFTLDHNTIKHCTCEHWHHIWLFCCYQKCYQMFILFFVVFLLQNYLKSCFNWHLQLLPEFCWNSITNYRTSTNLLCHQGPFLRVLLKWQWAWTFYSYLKVLSVTVSYYKKKWLPMCQYLSLVVLEGICISAKMVSKHALKTAEDINVSC